ncbi:WD repeat and HMG-box DNA-binding protein 1 [Athalia rosae]|uniref:WD repeat and HMG-box DNA-binding protein 1 n=1 Tax=Athalia rosae TaxID=37344 RepID=UPI0020341E3D|nr:WD repeat and HMG-box DNA-binding protein 1 [Athalia rosae]
MPLNRKPLRYAHPEGHTDVCYFSGKKGGLLTCGVDGDVRSWLNLMDDDPASSCVSEQVISVVSKNEKVYVATDNNTVQILTYPDLEKEGIINRFTGTVCCLATTRNGNFIVSGSCDMQIQVSNYKTSDTFELVGHTGPILGLSLDPKEEYVASSSTDGSIRVWDIKQKKVVHIWNDIVPKGNSFFTSRTRGMPSFECKDGKILAYPLGKEVVIVQRTSWKESLKLKCPDLRAVLSICKFSNCGTLLAASSIHGELVVWDVKSGEQIGYITHDNKAKITSIAWSLDKPTEIAFCDSLGMLGCVEVVLNPMEEIFPEPVGPVELDQDLNDRIGSFEDGNDSLDGHNVASKMKIQRAIDIDDSDDSQTAPIEPIIGETLPTLKLQAPFQPGSSPIHLLTRYMAWNTTGIVKCYFSEDRQESSIEVEFHDSSVHHPLHINNYLQHSLAALSPHVLALACAEDGNDPSTLVCIRLQGWGSNNKEWTCELPRRESAICLAAGDSFVALTTNKRRLRLFTASGTQRQIIALPGSPIAMNALQNHLVVVYHTGTSGLQEDQQMAMMWLQFRGMNISNRSLAVPLSGRNLELVWVGLTDQGSPAIMDEDGVLAIYDRVSAFWNVACDTANQCKSVSDRFFIIGVSELEKTIRCVLCKGSLYPPTAPIPVQMEIPLKLPLLEPDSLKSQMEAKLCHFSYDARTVEETLLSLFVIACRANVEYRAVDLCEDFGTPQVLELAMKYAARLGRLSLVNKLQSMWKTSEQSEAGKDQVESKTSQERANRLKLFTVQPLDEECHGTNDVNKECISTAITHTKPEMEIKPMTFSLRRQNPFKKKAQAPALEGLDAMNQLSQSEINCTLSEVKSLTEKSKPKAQTVTQSKAPKESFTFWYAKNKKALTEELPDLDMKQIMLVALERYKANNKILPNSSKAFVIQENKKRKLSDIDDEEKQNCGTTAEKLSAFAFTE